MNELSSYNANLNLWAASTKNVIEIGAYYLRLIAGLKRSRRLNASESCLIRYPQHMAHI